MSRLSYGFLGTALVIALGLASIQVQLVEAGSAPSNSGSAVAAAEADAHSGH